MSIFRELRKVPPNVRGLVCCGVFLLSALMTYSFFEDTQMLEKRISARQKDLALVLQLRDSFESKKRSLEKATVRRPDQQPLSLALVEDMIGKNFIGGRLLQLQPLSLKEGKGDRQAAIELKITGAPLGEVVSFVRTAEDAGLQVVRFRLSLPPSNPMALDMQATVTERRSRG